MKIGIIGANNNGKSVALELAQKTDTVCDICVLSDVLDSEFADSKKNKPYVITKLPEFKQPWVDPKTTVFNYKKHQETCAKNRKARKNKKRR